MLFKLKSSDRPRPLKPFLFRIREGFLLGLASEPEKGSPCKDCVEKWLRERNVWVEKAEISDLKIRRDLIPELLVENTPHTLYEIANDGTSHRLESVVFPHPSCTCARNQFIPTQEWTKKTNFAFSPITQLRCARFGATEGNLWLSSACGESPLTRAAVRTYGVATEREESRFQAVHEWMKRAALDDLGVRLSQQENVLSEDFLTGKTDILTTRSLQEHKEEVTGSGATRSEATLDALQRMAAKRTLKQYANSMKNPMLVVGANNWVRGKVPFFLLQQYDLHLLFYPNSTPTWIVGVAALSRVRTDEKPKFFFGFHHDMNRAIENALSRCLETCRPADTTIGDVTEVIVSEKEKLDAPKITRLNMWWTHWIYRCPKISLKDVLHLEAYSPTLEIWQEYYRDGMYPVDIVGINHSLLPSALRHLVLVRMPVESQLASRNVAGIGTWANFAESLA